MAAPLKDAINRQAIENLGDQITQHFPAFDHAAFMAQVEPQLDALELKDRINLVADSLADQLPHSYPEALAVVVAVAEAEADLDGWMAWPLCSFVERHGVAHPDESLAAMPALTKRWSCEFAIRPYLDQHLDLTRRHCREWTKDDDEAVRRLPSEGTRPLLPWGPRVDALIEDPQIGLELISLLRHDSSETVRRSVANHLNDVAKFAPETVTGIVREWMAEDPAPELSMMRHGLRTLVKQGNTQALELLGFTTEPKLGGIAFACQPAEITIGESIKLNATLKSTADHSQRLVVDFVVHHINASGATSPKVFKWTTVNLEPGQQLEISKQRLIKQASTRTYRAGWHRVDLQISGQEFASTGFELSL